MKVQREGSSDELLIRLVCQFVNELRPVLVDLPSEVSVEIQVVLSLVDDVWLTRVEAEHVSLAHVKVTCVQDLRSFHDSAAHSRTFVRCRGSFAMTTMVPV